MKLLKVYWTSTAVKQRNYIFEYWNERNKSTSFSKKLNTRIKKRVALLKTYPFLGKMTVFKNTRTVSMDTIVYFISQRNQVLSLQDFGIIDKALKKYYVF